MDAYAGGVVGVAFDDIKNCYNIGEVSAISDSSIAHSGGILGTGTAYIEYCYNIGSMTSSSAAGGIIGIKEDSYKAKEILGCYFLDNIAVGVGEGVSGGTACTNEQMQQKETFVGFDFEDIWTIDSKAEYKMPTFKAQDTDKIS